MKSLTSTAGDIPKSMSLLPESPMPEELPAGVRHVRAVPPPWLSCWRAEYDITRANCVVIEPPSPMKAWVKFPELRTKVLSPSPKVVKFTVTPAHADKTTWVTLYGRPRRM